MDRSHDSQYGPMADVLEHFFYIQELCAVRGVSKACRERVLDTWVVEDSVFGTWWAYVLRSVDAGRLPVVHAAIGFGGRSSVAHEASTSPNCQGGECQNGPFPGGIFMVHWSGIPCCPE